MIKRDLLNLNWFRSPKIKRWALILISRQYKPLWAFLAIWAISFSLCLVILDPDFGWHLQSGNYIRQFGIPAHDIFSYTASSFPWVNHEWLNDVFTSVLFQIGERTLVAFFFALIWASGMTLASRLYNLPTILISFVSILDFVMARPSAWLLFFFALLERILEKAKPRTLLFVPALMLIWVNLHGSFIIGLGILIFYKIFIKSPIPWPIIIASFAVTFINPYGPQVYVEIFRTVFDSQLHTRINEWRSWGVPNYFLLSGTVLLGIFFALEKKLKHKEYVLPVLMAVISLSSVRYYLLFMASTVRHYENAVDKLQKKLAELYGKFTMLYFVSTITVCIVGIIFYEAITSNPPLPELSSEYLIEHACPGNLFNFYDYGGYLIWKNPGQKVFIDGRMPSWKEDGVDYFQLYSDILTSPTRREELFKTNNVRCVVFTTGNQVFVSNLKSEGWKAVIEEPGSILLVR